MTDRGTWIKTKVEEPIRQRSEDSGRFWCGRRANGRAARQLQWVDVKQGSTGSCLAFARYNEREPLREESTPVLFVICSSVVRRQLSDILHGCFLALAQGSYSVLCCQPERGSL